MNFLSSKSNQVKRYVDFEATLHKLCSILTLLL